MADKAFLILVKPYSFSFYGLVEVKLKKDRKMTIQYRNKKGTKINVHTGRKNMSNLIGILQRLNYQIVAVRGA